MTEADPLVAYIAAHRERFTREAINAELIKAGHQQWTIDAAWAAFDASTGQADPATRMPGVGTILLVLAVIAGYTATALFALSFTLPANYFHMTGTATTVLLVYVAAMAAGCVYSVWRLLRAPSTGGGARAIGIAFAISVAIFVGLSGLCVAGLSTAGTG